MAGGSQVKYISLIARLFASATFLLSGFLKVLNPGGFLLDIQAFTVFPYELSYLLSLLVPSLEIVCSIALWKRSSRAASIAILSLMTVGFIALIAYEEWQGLNLNCGCFGDWLFFPNFYFHIGFNCILLAALLLNLEQSNENKEA
jgi:uncharacterized membrane protein YphA (DoxX/SURF4 family)